MRQVAAILACATLSACATDSYTGGAPSNQAADLWACKKQANAEYFRQPQIAIGGLFGAAGALIGGAAAPMSAPALIERCMSAKGYAGTSR